MTRTLEAASKTLQKTLDLLDSNHQQREKDRIVILAMEWREAENKTLEFARDRLDAIGIQFRSVQALKKYYENAVKRVEN